MVGESGGMSWPKILSLSVLFFYLKERLALRGEMTRRVETILTAAPEQSCSRQHFSKSCDHLLL